MQGMLMLITTFQTVFSISKCFPNQNFLFETQNQPEILSKSTSQIYFESKVNIMHWFEMSQKPSVCTFDFLKITLSLTKVSLDMIYKLKYDVISHNLPELLILHINWTYKFKFPNWFNPKQAIIYDFDFYYYKTLKVT